MIFQACDRSRFLVSFTADSPSQMGTGRLSLSTAQETLGTKGSPDFWDSLFVWKICASSQKHEYSRSISNDFDAHHGRLFRPQLAPLMILASNPHAAEHRFMVSARIE